MSEPFLGEIRMFGGNFAPRGWAFCNGQLLPIAQNTALFFPCWEPLTAAMDRPHSPCPDLRGRVPLHWGQGTGLSNYDLGQKTGNESVTLLQRSNAWSFARDQREPRGRHRLPSERLFHRTTAALPLISTPPQQTAPK